ncbi:MAG TPA: microviridin/marinostatin family tricyclic proteinase inhibitor [Pyrinomonadaceae bacterium]|nr:microviridin/marinostatin family tricyclic proteinase inhibitor [Pyrinomonadaceae bacterium]
MRGRRNKDEAAAPSGAQATPFFARFLEGQHGDDAEARVTTRRGRASYTEKEGARKATAAKPAKLQTLKYPSDGDEQVFHPYQAEAAKVKGGSTRQTLKYPSDRDEGDPYVAVYIDAADAPKTARAKAKKDAKIRLTTKAADIDQVS